MLLRFLGAAKTVTGSCYLLSSGPQSILVDCGLFQGPRALRERNYEPFPVPPASLSHILLTHAHIDHSGRIPYLVKNGFRGRVITTAATADLAGVMLPDSGHVQEMEVEQKNRRGQRAGRERIAPMYTAQDGFASLEYFDRVEYGQDVDLGGGMRARFLDAGHILGSAVLEITVVENGLPARILFSGDLGNAGYHPLLAGPTPVGETDFLVMESTYGDRLHQDKRDPAELLAAVVNEAYARGGPLIIPAFAAERTQDLLYFLHRLWEGGRIPPLPVYIDSPMAIAATAVFEKHHECYGIQVQDMLRKGEEPLDFAGVHYARTVEESQALNNLQGPVIIISASGMADAGRVRHHLKHNLWRKEATVLFVGYQAEGTMGRSLMEGAKRVTIFGEEISVGAQIKNLDVFSAHADQKGLLEWARNFRVPPRLTFVVHGEPVAAETLARLLTQELGWPVIVPEWLGEYDLTGQTVVAPGLRQAREALDQKIRALEAENDQSKLEGLMKKLAELAEYVNQIAPPESPPPQPAAGQCPMDGGKA
ncbi:MAG TPA: MBL fold metallo-hydrolase [Spirochaetia bacterium]|nr:MBL fold metallo-hydrolase [Spirochaetia bacterium]